MFLKPLDDQWIIVNVDEIGQMMAAAVFIRCSGIAGTEGGGIVFDGVLPSGTRKA